MTRAQLRAAARRILRAGLKSVEPGHLLREHVRVDGHAIRVGGVRVEKVNRLFVVSVGKAATSMAVTAQKILGKRITATVVVAPNAMRPAARTTSFVAGHPIPNAEGARAGRYVIRLLEGARRDDLVLLLLSGGASALLPAPVDGVSLRDKQKVTRALLRNGASIDEINAVRKRLSRLKSGGFARLAAPARVVALALSDVPGNDPGTIGSGLAVHDSHAATNARRAALRFLKRKHVGPRVWGALMRPQESFPKTFRATTTIIGSGETFAEIAKREALSLGFEVVLLPRALAGFARDCGPALVEAYAKRRNRRPLCLIATGETVVEIRGKGKGGRNQELALASIPALARLAQPTVLAAFATDGRDGPTRASGGLVDDLTAGRARARGISIEKALARNDSNTALRRLGHLIVTGMTRTNIADVLLILG